MPPQAWSGNDTGPSDKSSGVPLECRSRQWKNSNPLSGGSTKTKIRASYFSNLRAGIVPEPDDAGLVGHRPGRTAVATSIRRIHPPDRRHRFGVTSPTLATRPICSITWPQDWLFSCSAAIAGRTSSPVAAASREARSGTIRSVLFLPAR